MKIISILCLVVMIVLFSCTKTTNSTNTTVTVIPNSPTNLVGNVISSTRINLTWTDNATNEQGYKIERKLGMGNYTLIDSVSANVTNYADTSLTPNTTYTYKVYAYNITGSSLYYTNEVTLTTKNIPIVLTSFNSVDTSFKYDTIEFNNFSSGKTDTLEYTWLAGISILIQNISNLSIIEEGVVWDTSQKPTLNQSNKTVFNTNATLSSGIVKNLIPNTLYYCRGYVITNQGTYYGNTIKFKTLSLSAPIFNSSPSIDNPSGNLRTTINFYFGFRDGGYRTINRGLIWSKNPNPTIVLNSKDSLQGPNGGMVNLNYPSDGGREYYYDTVKGLIPNTTYYFVAYATNTLGTSYSNQFSFKTLL